MDLNGLPVTLLDTAGIRATNDVIEGLGIERALERSVKADLALILTDDGGLPDGIDEIGDKIFVFTKGTSPGIRTRFQSLRSGD